MGSMLTTSILSLLILLDALGVIAYSHYLHLTALFSDDEDPRARFECWEIATPYSTYPTVGEAIPGVADVTNVSYVVLPPRSSEGIHRPPHPMLVPSVNVARRHPVNELR